MSVRPPRRFQVPLFLLTLLAAALSLPAQPYGLTNRPVVGEFLNNQLPPAEVNPAGWQAVVAFPNVTFDDPTVITPEPNSTRLYIGERQGKIFFITNTPSVSVKTLFLDLSARTQGYNDSGLLGLAFHPQFRVTNSPNRGYVYVWYQFSPSPVGPDPQQGVAPPETPSYNRLSRFTVPDGSLVADPNSELVLINQFDRHLWHNGGGLFFGSDGFLYISNGDEGSANDPFNNTQKINWGLFSGVLRIDVDMDPGRSHPIRRQPLSGTPPNGWPPTYTTNYFIPNDNPWQATDGSVLEEFFAIGLRSPHRMTFDPPTGQIWLGDVGQENREEVSLIVRSNNYQWAFREGFLTGPKSQPNPVIGVSTPPVHDYPHADGNNCVIGGYVYRGIQFPTLVGKYIFGDNGSGRVWAMTYDGINPTVVTQLCVMPAPPNTYGLATFGLDQNGEIYMGIVGFGTRLYKLAAAGSQPPPPPALLSQTGFFTNLATLAPHPAAIPYDINSPLWSDGSDKGRWLVIPTDGAPYGPNELIGWSSNGNWSFPTGTVAVKHFELPLNETNPAVAKRLETRFLTLGTNGTWFGYTYKWRDDNSDADLLPDGLRETNLVITPSGLRTQVWDYPSRGDCRSCHNANAGGILGPRTHQFNRDLLYPQTGVTDNQLRALNAIGLFSPPLNEAAIPAMPRSVAVTDTNASLELRVRSYLDANCAHCHQPGGVRGQFDARLSTPLANQNLIGGTVEDTLGIPGAKVIRPQSTAQSVLFVRDNTLGALQMPPLARNVVDTNYIAVLAAWINSLPPLVELPNGLVGVMGNTATGASSDNIYDTAPYINAARFQASSNFTAAFIRAQVQGVTGRYKCALYEDDAGQPGALLAQSGDLINPATGWQTFPLTVPRNLTAGTFYWLAVWSDSPTARVFYTSTVGGTLRWGQYNYGAWPNPISLPDSGTYLYCLNATSGARPAFVATPTNRTINVLTTLLVTNTATDADAPLQSLTYYLLNAPTNASISTNGVITWVPQPHQAPSTNLITTAATDGVFSITNSFTVIVTNGNRLPEAVTDALTRWASQGLTTAVTNLLANDTDLDNDPLTLTTVTNALPPGTALTLTNGLVRYWPPFGNTNPGSFHYVITDGQGGFATGLVNVAVQPDPGTPDVLTLTAVSGGSVSGALAGVPGFTYTVQFTDALHPANWQNLAVVEANQAGQVNFTDALPPGQPQRYYRAVRGIAP